MLLKKLSLSLLPLSRLKEARYEWTILFALWLRHNGRLESEFDSKSTLLWAIYQNAMCRKLSMMSSSLMAARCNRNGCKWMRKFWFLSAESSGRPSLWMGMHWNPYQTALTITHYSRVATLLPFEWEIARIDMQIEHCSHGRRNFDQISLHTINSSRYNEMKKNHIFMPTAD